MRATPIAVLAAVVSACAAPADDTPIWTLQRGVLAYTATVDGDADIFVRRVGDAAPLNLTRHPGQDHWASWSPDGARIAFQSLRDGNREIYVMDADGANPVNLTRDPSEDLLPAWSPGGDEIAFFSTRGADPGPRGEVRGAVYRMAVDGGGVTRVTNDTLETSVAPAWSPDGTRIAFVRAGDLWTVGRDGTRERQLTATVAYEAAPAFSPNGREIASSVQRGDTAVIAVMNIDGSDVRELTAGTHDYYPMWSPDGWGLVFTGSGTGEQYDVLWIRFDGDPEVPLVATPADERRGVWRPYP